MQFPDSLIAIRYVDAAISQLRRLDLMRQPGKISELMADPSIPPCDDWHGWQPIASTVTAAELDGLEVEIGFRYPPLYRQLLQYLHFEQLTECGVRFEPHLPGVWQQTLRNGYFNSWPRERILDRGLILFGSETFMDAGAVCFDARMAANDNDWPVVFWDHEWVGTDREVRPMFSNCEKMFESLLFAANHDINFFSHFEDDDNEPELLTRKVELLSKFLAIDPAGAGGNAKDYWTSWGVQPKL